MHEGTREASMSSLALVFSVLTAGTFGELRVSTPSLRRRPPGWRSEASPLEGSPAFVRGKATWAWAWPTKRQRAQKTPPQNAVSNYSVGPHPQEIFT
jgi:hypothetical protein